MEYYRWDCMRYCMSVLGSICTCGFLLLVFRWAPIWALQCTHRPSHRKAASKAVVHSTDGQLTVVHIQKPESTEGEDNLLPRCFYFRNLRYFEREQLGSFAPMGYKAAQVCGVMLHVFTISFTLHASSSPVTLHLRCSPFTLHHKNKNKWSPTRFYGGSLLPPF